MYRSVALGRPGAVGDGNTAATFPGSDNADVVISTVPEFTSTPFTVEAWAKTSSTAAATIAGRNYYVPPANSCDIGRYLGFTIEVSRTPGYEGRAVATVVEDDSSPTETAVAMECWRTPVRRISAFGPATRVDDGRWHHIVAVFTPAAGITVYVDGVGQSTSAVLTTPIGAGALRFGDTDGSGPLAGDVDEGALYTNALSAERVRAHFDAGSEHVDDPDGGPAYTSGEVVEPPDPDPVETEDPDAPNEGPLPGGMSTLGTSTSSRPGVTYTAGPSAVKVRNADGIWTIFRTCADRTAGRYRYTVGPGYIARLYRAGTYIVNDYRARSDTESDITVPGHLNSVHGGLGAFGWHHARGVENQTWAGDDPTTQPVETGVGRVGAGVIDGRMCAEANGGIGIYDVKSSRPSRISSTHVALRVDVWLRDQYGAAARVRYKYSFFRSEVRVWIAVTTYAQPNGAGIPMVKEPKFAAVARGAGSKRYRRMAVFSGATGTTFEIGVLKGEPESPTAVLDTEHSAHDGRKRVRWDYGTVISKTQDATGGPHGCSADTPCLNVVMQTYATTGDDILRNQNAYNWEGGGHGLDRWAVQSGNNPDGSPKRARAYLRDTRGEGVVSWCGQIEVNGDDRNGDRNIADDERSFATERASPDADGSRRWEHGGWKVADPTRPADENHNLYDAAMTLFHGWEDGRGGHDCEPLQRAFGPPGEIWGTYASYSLNDGWAVR